MWLKFSRGTLNCMTLTQPWKSFCHGVSHRNNVTLLFEHPKYPYLNSIRLLLFYFIRSKFISGLLISLRCFKKNPFRVGCWSWPLCSCLTFCFSDWPKTDNYFTWHLCGKVSQALITGSVLMCCTYTFVSASVQ